MYTRLIPAAKQLTSEVEDMGKPYKVTQGEPDGYGFIREIGFDARTSKWLVPILDAIGDERIRTIDYEGKGRASITFVGDTRADFSQPFGVAAVDKVLSGDDSAGSIIEPPAEAQ